MPEFFDLTPMIIFSQWDLLEIGLISFGLGAFSIWYSNKRNSRVNDKTPKESLK